MRLLNKTTFQIESFLDDEAPPYIILSHRWSGAETSMLEFAAQRHLSKDQWSAGTSKVLTFCEHILPYEVQYAWVDTCCIDKSSSAELQEAINSMFKWYQQAELCVVYMHDVDLLAGDPADGDDSLSARLEQSEWFTRGWTLQELLAPRDHVFLDRNWQRLGTRDELSGILHEITKIKPSYYGNANGIRSAPVAERMSWLSLRTTSRIEDMAYCVLGVFDVNMTMLYGEGAKAFIRLQKEIIQNIDDESIFVWQSVPGDSDKGSCIPVLAPQPACFAVCRDLTITKSVYLNRDPYRWTMKGLEFELYGQRRLQFSETELQVILNCVVNGRRVAFDIRKTSFETVYQRVAASGLSTLGEQSYYYPPTAEDAYRRQVHRLAFESMSHLHQDPYGTRRATSVMDYEGENVLFKVFIQ